MDIQDFKQSLASPAAPAGLPRLLEALWWDSKGDWERAHGLAQDVPNRDGAWVHALLHREEGDQGNAAYWYRQAGRPVCRESLAEERDQLIAFFLEKAS